MTRWLVDTGPLVSILDRRDRDHARCVDAFRSVKQPLLTTWPVLTEAAYLLGFSRKAQDALMEMIQRASIAVAALSVEDVPRMRMLMGKYRDVPMDLADASVVCAAERENIETVLTLDKDFTVYRLGRNRSISIRP
jgi:uncharacterized protein